MHKTNRLSKLSVLKRSIMGLFVENKQNVTLKRRKNDYYKHHYLNSKLSEGIELVALSERISRKAALEKLITLGFSVYMGAMVTKAIRDEGLPEQTDALMAQKRFIMLLKRMADQNGVNLTL
jgi:hypothetical protein